MMEVDKGVTTKIAEYMVEVDAHVEIQDKKSRHTFRVIFLTL